MSVDVFDDMERGEPREAAVRVSTAQLTVLAFLGTATMLFAGFASAYLVRREGLDWLHLQLPRVLYFNTVILLASSAAMEIARRMFRRWELERARFWIGATAALGVVFLAGQILAWRQFVAQGVYLPSNPYAAFFYVLTALHGLHLLGGIGALVYVFARLPRSGLGFDGNALAGAVLYWHFVDVLWVSLFVLLLFF